MSEQNNATNSLAHSKWNCKYHIVFAPKYRRKVFYEEKRKEIRDKRNYPNTMSMERSRKTKIRVIYSYNAFVEKAFYYHKNSDICSIVKYWE